MNKRQKKKMEKKFHLIRALKILDTHMKTLDLRILRQYTGRRKDK